MRTPFLGPFNVTRSRNYADNRLVNLYPEFGAASKDVGAFYMCPGLSLLVTCGTGPIRGMAAMAGNLYVVSAGNVYQVSPSFQATLIGTIPSASTPVTMIVNVTAPTSTNLQQIAIFDGQNGYLIQNGTVTQINLPFSGPVSAKYQDGFGFVNQTGTNQWWQSNLQDLSTWSALAFSSADAQPDNIIAIGDIHREVFLFKQYNTEVWVDAGLSNFAFERLDGPYIETGIAAPYSLAKAGESLLWLTQNKQGQGQVAMLEGYNARIVSTHAIEHAIQSYQTISDAIGYAYQQEGHLFYVLTFPTGDATWCLDLSSTAEGRQPMWHQRAAFLNGQFHRHWGNCATFFAGENVVGDYLTGNLYAFSLNQQLDNFSPRKWVRSWRALQKPVENPVSFKSLRIDMETGAGVSEVNYNASTNLLTDGNFTNGFTGWTLTVGGNNSPVVATAPDLNIPATPGSWGTSDFVLFNNGGGNNTLSQMLSIAAGTTLDVSGWLSVPAGQVGPISEWSVTWNGVQVFGENPLTPATPWAQSSGEVVATGSDLLAITFQNSNTTTFDPNAIPGTDGSPSGALTNNNLTANYENSAGLIQTLDAYETNGGQYYWEFTMNFSSSSNTDHCGIIGYICDRNEVFNDFTTSVYMWISPSGEVSLQGANVINFGTLTTGVNIGVALLVEQSGGIDTAQSRIWFRVNGGNWNNSGTANPATNTGGHVIGAGNAFYFPFFACASIATAGDTIVLNSGGTPFAYTEPVGFGPLVTNAGVWASFPAFDPNNTCNGASGSQSLITLSNTNHTAKVTGNPGSFNPCAVVAGPGRSSGKFYLEFTIGAAWGSNLNSLGFYCQDNALTSQLGTNVAGVGIRDNGTVLCNNTSIGTGATYTTGSLVCVAINLALGLIWYRVGANGNWNNNAANNPATATGGFSLAAMLLPVNAAVSMHDTNDIVTINCGDSVFVGAEPTGFVGYWNGPALGAGNYAGFGNLSVSGAVATDNPQVVLRWSDDGGHNWSDEYFASAGKEGQTAQRVKFNRLGATKRNAGLDRIFELSSTDAFNVALIAAELDAQ